MNVVPTNLTVADYCAGMARREIEVNRDYQRSDRVWPDAARSFLIETLLLGYPMPKLTLHQVADPRARTIKKWVVDGQQRSRAIYDFYTGRLELSRALSLTEAAGRDLDGLPDELQQAFLTYPLSVDLLAGVTDEEVREVFRRINSYTIPLNPEEQRHARFQGRFKWFIHRLTRDLSQALLDQGVFSEKQLVRMQDAKLFTEIADALLFGIRTTDKGKLDSVYRAHDVEFPEEQRMEARTRRAFNLMSVLEPVRGTELSKPLQAYALALALIDAEEPVPALWPRGTVVRPAVTVDVDVATRGLAALEEALRSGDDYNGPYQAFVLASKDRTNVADQRRTRFVMLRQALAGELPTE